MNNIVFEAIDLMIQWMNERKGRVTYSMVNRYGPDSYDCSSAVYYALIYAGFLNAGNIGNTETLFNDLERYGWKKVNAKPYYKGDIFIWGERGASSGSAGHTGIFLENNNIIHCNYSANGISTDDYDEVWNQKGNPIATIYRYGSNELPTFNFELSPLVGTFIPNQSLPVCSEPTEASPALDYYLSGQSINYDSYCINDGYIWISYIAYSGYRRYVAVGPNDGIDSNVWGTGFDKSII